MQIVHKQFDIDLSKPVYECRTCEKAFNWDKDSCWYGLYAMQEKHPEKVEYYCSDNCFCNRTNIKQ